MAPPPSAPPSRRAAARPRGGYPRQPGGRWPGWRSPWPRHPPPGAAPPTRCRGGGGPRVAARGRRVVCIASRRRLDATPPARWRRVRRGWDRGRSWCGLQGGDQSCGLGGIILREPTAPVSLVDPTYAIHIKDVETDAVRAQANERPRRAPRLPHEGQEAPERCGGVQIRQRILLRFAGG